MRYVTGLIACSILLANCTTPDVDVYPTGTYDTLGVQWMTIERHNVIYYFQGTGINGASIYTDMHEEAYTELEQVFSPILPAKLRYFVWTDWEQAESALGLPLGFATPEYSVCNVTATHSLGHEMTHILSYWAGGVRPKSVTRFVMEGVAVAFDLNDNDKIERAKAALSRQSIKSVTDLWAGDQQEAPEEVFYPIAGGFIDFLYKKNMPENFYSLLKNQTMQEAELIYGKEELHSLIAEYDALIGL